VPYRAQQTVIALMDAVSELEAAAPTADALKEVLARGFFRPTEEEKLAHWFARFLTQREALWAVIDEVDQSIDVPLNQIREPEHLRRFLPGYAAACLLVRQDRFLLAEVANDTLVQRKLNEGFAEYRVPRKQFSAIFSSYTDPVAAFQLYEAMRLVCRRRREIGMLADDKAVDQIVDRLSELESFLDPSKRNYVKGFLGFLSHRWCRRGASARQQTIFAVLEGVGRTASRINPGKHKLVTPEVREQLSALLLPGDVIISRHRYALTNYLLPGVWPHAALFIGTAEQRSEYGIQIEAEVAERWSGSKCTLEALRDGVLFRSLADTLNVDYFTVIRPKLSRDELAEGIARVVKHEGKSYNFDFDFFTSDKLVCTEVVYRALDGIGGIHLPLSSRAGRRTLSAEDLLDLALANEVFEPLAMFGFPEGFEELVTGEDVWQPLRNSYRSSTGPEVSTAPV
jgi:hypothetical protein